MEHQKEHYVYRNIPGFCTSMGSASAADAVASASVKALLRQLNLPHT